MPNKRSRSKQKKYFFCYLCGSELSRLGSPKHFLYYTEAVDIRRHLGISLKIANILAAEGAFVTKNAWIEEFFCETHGCLWMVVTRKPEGLFATIPANRGDWSRSTKTTNPNQPNPSVSEYTYRMSRRSNGGFLAPYVDRNL